MIFSSYGSPGLLLGFDSDSDSDFSSISDDMSVRESSVDSIPEQSISEDSDIAEEAIPADSIRFLSPDTLLDFEAAAVMTTIPEVLETFGGSVPEDEEKHIPYSIC